MRLLYTTAYNINNNRNTSTEQQQVPNYFLKFKFSDDREVIDKYSKNLDNLLENVKYRQ